MKALKILHTCVQVVLQMMYSTDTYRWTDLLLIEKNMNIAAKGVRTVGVRY